MRPSFDELPKLHVGGKEAAPDRLHQEAVVRSRRVGHPRRLRVVEGERLLAEHVLAGIQVEQRVVTVAAVRGAHVHHVDVEVVGHCLVRAVAVRDRVLDREAIGARLRA